MTETKPKLPRLTLWRITRSQLRALITGPSLSWSVGLVFPLAAVIGLVTGLLYFLSGGKHFSSVGALDSAFALASVTMQLFAISVGVAAFAGEFATGTITGTASVAPRRTGVFVAKLIAAFVFVLIAAVASGALAGGGTALVAWAGGHPFSVEAFAVCARMIAGMAVGAAMIATAVSALGVLVRQRVVTVLTPLVVLYLVPLIVGALPPGSMQNTLFGWLPSSALSMLVVEPVGPRVSTIELFSDGGLSLGLGVSLIVLVVWCVPLAVIAGISFSHRDISVSAEVGLGLRPTKRASSETPSTPHRSSLGRLLASEFRKTWTLPTVRWISIVAVLVEIGYGVVRASSSSILTVGGSHLENLSIELDYAITDGIGVVTILLAAIAAIQVAGEFETGTAIPTFVSARRRWDVTSSKILGAIITAIVVGLAAMLITALIVVPIYAARGYPPTADTLTVAGAGMGKALLFLALATSLSAGIAGITRRIVPTMITVCVLFIIGPAVLNSILGVARLEGGPFILLGNAGRFLPWEGSRFYEPQDGVTPFAATDVHGVLIVSAGFGLMVTAIWAALAVVGWTLGDARRPIVTRG